MKKYCDNCNYIIKINTDYYCTKRQTPLLLQDNKRLHECLEENWREDMKEYYEKKTDNNKLRYDLLTEVESVSGWLDDNILMYLNPMDELTLEDLELLQAQVAIALGGASNYYRELARVYTFGADKYGDESWKTVPDAEQRYTAALFRHLDEFRRGNYINHEDGEVLHLAQVAWNAVAIMYFMRQEEK